MNDTVYWNRLRYLINHGLASSEDEIDWTQHGGDEDTGTASYPASSDTQ